MAGYRVLSALSELQPGDLAPVVPPPDVWDAIAASLASGRAEMPGDGTSTPALVVEYLIDADDVVTGVSEGYAEFARANGAPELVEPSSDRTLWSAFDGDEIRELWQLVVQRVRTEHTEAQVPFRCDAAHARRWFEMTVSPAEHGCVRFRSVQMFEEEREPIALLDHEVTRDAAAPAIALCSWCGRGERDGEWLEIDDLVQAGRLLELDAPPPVSFGICNPCRREMSAELLVPSAAER